MMKTTRYARTSALPAIAAALALSSTPVFAQETPAQPTTPTTTAPSTTPTDPVSAAPAPALDTTTPAATDTTVTTTSTAPAAKVKTVKTVKTRHVATAVKPVAAHTVAQKTVTRTTTHAAVPAAAAPAAAPVAAPAPAAPAPSQSAVTPIVNTNAAPAKPAQTATAKPSNGVDSTTAMEVGGGALALIALGAGAWALSRRRHDEDEVIYEDSYEPEADHVAHEPEMAAAAEPMAEEMPRHDPVEDPNLVAPAASAFAWGKPDPATQAEDDGSDRNPGETWVERAYRGPSPANPSVSLKTRLRRAAFFDKRERDVAAGVAEPVDTDAGLPDAMADEQEREIA